MHAELHQPHDTRTSHPPQQALTRCRRLALVAILALSSACVSPASQPLQAARGARGVGDLVTAIGHYERALTLAPGHKVVQQELAAARGELVGQAIAQAGSRAGSDPSPADLREALALLQRSERYGRGLPAYAAAVRGYEERIAAAEAASEASASKLRSAMTQGRLDVADRELQALRALDPGWPGLGAVESELEGFRVEHGSRRAAAALDAGDMPGARAILAELEGVSHPRVNELRARFESVELDWIRDQVERLTAQDRYYTAFLEIQASDRVGELGALLRQVRMDGADHYLEQARLRLSRDEAGRAYLEAMKGLELSPDDPRLFDVHRDARDEQLDEIQTYIAVPTFATPSSHPDLGAQFSDALISHLFRVLPYGVNIVEREKIDLLMREQQAGFAELGDVLNVDLIVSGNVSLMQIDRQESEQQSLARVQVGERHEPNPAYEAAYRSAVRTGQLQQGAQPGRQLKLPEPTIAVPVYETVKYEKGSVTIKGFSTVAARIFSTQQAAIVYAQEFNARYDATDTFQDAVDHAGVEGDALVLPTDTEVVEALRKQLVGKVSALIEDQFAARHQTYLDDAKYRLARREPDKAMTPLASGFLYAVKAQVDADDAAFGELRELIASETEHGFLRPGDMAGMPEVVPDGLQ